MSALFGPAFLQHALLAGAAIAAAAGLVGYFLVLRAQVFTVDALSHVAFTGALAALAFGVDARIGLFTATIAVALLMGALGRRGRADDVVIGNIFAWVLGLGVFFLTLYTTSRSATGGNAGVTVLFGSIFGLSAAQATTAALVALGVVVGIVLLARPLLFASIDETVAAARGVPVRLLGYLFLALVGAATAEATQAVGALLLSGALAVVELVVGLELAHLVPVLPPSFAILAVTTGVYAAVGLVTAVRARRAIELR